jgi:hypothetical protein
MLNVALLKVGEVTPRYAQVPAERVVIRAHTGIDEDSWWSQLLMVLKQGTPKEGLEWFRDYEVSPPGTPLKMTVFCSIYRPNSPSLSVYYGSNLKRIAVQPLIVKLARRI